MKSLLFCAVLTLWLFATFAAPVVTGNLLLNPGGEANNLTNWLAGGDSGPRLDAGFFDTNIKPHSGTNDFVGGTGSLGSLSQTIALVGNQGVTATALDSGNLLAYLSFWEQGLNQGEPSDHADVKLLFLGATTNTISAVTTPEVDQHFNTWSNYSNYVPIPAGTRYIQYSMNFTRAAGNDLDAFVDDNILSVVDSRQVPRLAITGSTTNALLSWPVIYSDGFQLQQISDLTTNNWSLANVPVSIVNGTNQVSVALATRMRFFRLFHP